MQNHQRAKCYWPSALAFLCLTTATSAESSSAPYLASRTEEPRPIAELPATVEAKDEAISLVADFTDVGPRHVTLYLVNRTNEGVAFATQDRFPYVFLEAMRVDGTWERAQTHHYSWCGNSYHPSPTLMPDHFFRLGGYLPETGEERTVRYRVYADNAYIVDDTVESTDGSDWTWQIRRNAETIPVELISNAGPGKAMRGEIRTAREDKLAKSRIDCDSLYKTAVDGDDSRNVPLSRLHAVRQLGRCLDGKTAAVLAPLLGDDDKEIRLAAVRSIGAIADESYGAELTFKKIIEGKDDELRNAAISHLQDRAPSVEVVEYATQLLADKDPKIQIKAIRVLGKLWCLFPEALTALKQHHSRSDAVQAALDTALIPEFFWCSPPSIEKK